MNEPRTFAEMSAEDRKEWLENFFEFENCDECQTGAEGHNVVPGPFGDPFAYCKNAPNAD